MAIFLTVLKIIGIVLLSLIALIVILLLLILFWPLPYSVRFRKEDSIYLRIRVSWLFHIVSARLLSGGKTDFTVKVLGITVYRKDFSQIQSEDESQTSNNNKDENGQTDQEEQTSSQTEEENKQTDCITDSIDNLDENTKDYKQSIEDFDDEEDPDAYLYSLSIWGKIKYFMKEFMNFIHKLIAFFGDFRCSVKRLYDKIVETYHLAEYYYKVWNRPKTKTAINLCKVEGMRLLKHLKPDKIVSQTDFGTGDPASTAQYFGYFCMLQPWLGKSFHMKPDFENKVFVNHTYARGKVFIVVLIRIVWKLYFDKDLRKLIRLVKREGKKNGRE